MNKIAKERIKKAIMSLNGIIQRFSRKYDNSSIVPSDSSILKLSIDQILDKYSFYDTVDMELRQELEKRLKRWEEKYSDVLVIERV